MKVEDSKKQSAGPSLGSPWGWVAYRLLKSMDHYQVEVLLTLALVTGGYALASALHTSGPIAIVCAGVLIGNHGRRLAMSDTTASTSTPFGNWWMKSSTPSCSS